MFKALKLNPFSTPSDTRLTFRAEQLPRLYTSSIPYDEHEYWSHFYTLFDNAYDVLNLLSASVITRALQAHPENVTTLVHVLSDRLQDILQSPDFPSTATETRSFAQGLTYFRPGFLNSKQGQDVATSKPDLTKELLNCLRVLSRVIPFILAHEDRSLEQTLFWSATAARPSRSASEVSIEPNHFVIDDEDEEEEDGGSQAGNADGTKANDQPTGPPLAERLLDAAVELLFVHGFTIPSGNQVVEKKISYQIWENGIGSTLSLPSTREIDNNRSEVLQFLLSMLSKTLYVPSNAYTASVNLADTHPSGASAAPPSFNKWHAYLVRPPIGAKARKQTLSLLCSLLNTALKSGAAQAASSHTLVGTVGDAVGDSYEKLVSGGKRKVDSPRLTLVKACVQVLNALLCTPTPAVLAQALQAEQARRHGGNTENNVRSPPATPAPGRMVSYSGALAQNAVTTAADSNAFQFFLTKLHRDSDLSFIIENLLVILLQPMNTSFLKLPLEAVGVASSSSPTMATDFLVLLWKLVECNPHFAPKLLAAHKNVHQVLGVLVYCCLEYKDKPAHLGLVKLAAFLLQTLSADPAFGSALNIPLSNSVPMPAKYIVQGTALDFLIQHLYTLIFSTKGLFNAIYPAFILTIGNISPYIKNPSIKSSTMLIQLFMAISNPGFLLSDEANPRLVFYLLEAFNNVIQYQLRECPHLIYAIIRSHARFEELANFTLAGGVSAIRKRRKQRLNGGELHTPPKSPRRLSMASENMPSTTTPGLVTELSEQVAQRIEDQEKAALAQQQQVQSPSPASPTSEYPPRFAASKPLSEKAAGKQRARSTSQSSFPPGSLNASHADLTSLYSESDEADEGPYVSKSGFMPTESWVASWREGLPIDGILILVSECLTKISSLSSLSPSSNSAAIEKYLRSVNLDGLLPPTSPAKARPFQSTSLHSILWLMSLSWGNAYVQSLESTSSNNGLSNWRDTHVRLFNVRQSASGSLAGGVNQVQAAMSSLVEQGLGMLNLGSTPANNSSTGRQYHPGGGNTPRRSMSRNNFGVV